MHGVAEAQQIVLQHVEPLSAQSLRINSSALGFVLAEDVRSSLDIPAFRKSMMDGFAVRANDCAHPNTQTQLRIVAEITAGQVPQKAIGAGEAARIMTGAWVPDGADAVVMIEQCRVTGDLLAIGSPAVAGQHIQPIGRELGKGEIALAKGSEIRAAHIGLLALVGKTEVQAVGRPNISVITTGNEVIEADQMPRPGQIRNSNGPMLVAQCATAGAQTEYLGIAPDQPEQLGRLIRKGLDANILVLSGGVSAGKLDLVPDILRECGVTAHVHHVAMKPGKPLFFGTRGSTLVFGLPGNPVSSFVGFELFVRPAIRRFRSVQPAITPPIMLPLANSFRAKAERPTYHPAKIEIQHGEETVHPVAWHGSPDLRGLCAADALAVFAPGDHTLAAGSPVPVIRIPC